MRLFLRNIIALFALLASFTVASTTVVHAVPTGGVGVQLADPSRDPSFPAWETEIGGTVAPGTVVTRHVRVTNTGSTTQTVDVYAGAASMRRGVFTDQGPGSTNRLTSWTSLDKSKVTLPGLGNADVKVTVRIPADAPTGDRSAVIWAQPATAGGGGVVSTSRVGVRMNFRVGPGAGTTADFAIDGLTAERDSDGQAVIVADIRNTGGWAVEVGGEVTLSDGPGGRTLGPVWADETIVAVGVAGKVRFRVPNSAELPAGPWTAHVSLGSGPVERQHSTSVTFPTPDAGGGGSLGSLGSSDSPLMWVGVAGAAAAAIGAIGWTVLQQQNAPLVR
ncbi:hypothetical protein C8K36_10644 [Rhodococcus sp. OK519]|uniref:hypothetical protein n=1 Tax=Rhodococcus sp. OK519 TaxID=2135729 RepID=UPI000D3989FC|nr:hypothetical protein C8K36_10644 [Rhodococcus sp. OK519]